MKKIALLILAFLLLPFQSFAKLPQPEYVSMKKISAICGLGEVLGCMTHKPFKIYIYWKIQMDKKLKDKIYWHEVGHYLTGNWERKDFIKKLGFADINENDVITLSEKMANLYEDYKTIGIKDKKAIKVFKQLEKSNIFK